jgi:hypothetical protein
MFSVSDHKVLRDGCSKINGTYEGLMAKCLCFRTDNRLSTEYLHNGFLRRLGVLKRCIENVYSICPVERVDKPKRDELLDVTINLQSFLFNVFGSIDDLAWVWAAEKDLKTEKGEPLKPKDKGFHTKSMRKTLPDDFRAYLDGLRDWFDYLEDYRHALAHRIPLYIPPYTAKPEDYLRLEALKNEAHSRRDFEEWLRLDAEQDQLGKFVPIMMHSYGEGARPVGFHNQILNDWTTVAQIAEKVLAQLTP